MSVIRFHMTSPLSPTQAMAVLTDFSPTRPDLWPSVDAEHFTVHDRGENWAEVTEGTATAWERARYDWDPAARRVTVTTHESKVFGPGGGWVFRFAPAVEGTRIDVELTREPHTFKQKLLGLLLPLVGPASFRKGFATPFQTHATSAAR